MDTQADYLKELGVDIWLPRTPLAHAAQSPAWVYQFVHPSSLSPSELTAAPEPTRSSTKISPKAKSGVGLPLQHAEQRSMAHISEALADESVVSKTSPLAGAGAKPVVSSSDQRSKSPLFTPRFRLAVTRTPRFLLVDELPMQGRQILDDNYKRLLAGVVNALGEDPQQMSLSVVLQWPQLAGSKLNQDSVEAFKYVQRTLSSLQRQTQVEHLLLFGPNLGRWVIGEEQSKLTTGELFLHPQQNISCLATAMLSQALQLPDIKRQIWLDLQPVIRG